MLSLVTSILLSNTLITNAAATWSSATPESVAGAEAAAVDDIPVDVLLGIAFVESDFNPKSVSRIQSGKRTTGILQSSSKPKNTTGTYFCGVTQATAVTWSDCIDLQAPDKAFQKTVNEIHNWMESPYCHSKKRKLECALSGYGYGNAGAKKGTSPYARNVLYQAGRLRYVRGHAHIQPSI